MNLFTSTGNTGILSIDETSILFDIDDLKIIKNPPKNCKYTKKIWRVSKHDNVYTRNTNNKKIYLIDILYDIDYKKSEINFKDNNRLNLKKDNVIIIKNNNEENKKKIKNNIPYDVEIINYIGSITTKMGKDAGKIKNHHWLVKDTNTDEEYIVMHCLKNNYTKISSNFLPKLFNIRNKIFTWSTVKNNFYATNIDGKCYYLHAYVAGLYDNGHNSENLNDCVHINKNTDDNRNDNIKYIKNNVDEKSNGELDENGLIKYIGNDTKIIKYIGHHIPTKGRDAGKIKNKHWLVRNTKTNNEYIVMECTSEGDNIFYTKVSVDFLPKLFNIDGKAYSWYKMDNDYYAANAGGKARYLHAHVMDYYGHGIKKNIKTIDHLNRQKDDNRTSNLALKTQSEQNKNTDKRARKKNAQDLPEELKGITLPKFVNYNREKISNGHGEHYRDFFRIEKHPKLKKVWSSSKSTKIGILEKLEETKKRLSLLENDGVYEKKKKLPLYVLEIIDKRNSKKCYIFDKQIKNIDGKKQRHNLKYTCKDTKTDDENYEIFKAKLFKKYGYSI